MIFMFSMNACIAFLSVITLLSVIYIFASCIVRYVYDKNEFIGERADLFVKLFFLFLSFASVVSLAICFHLNILN